MAAAVGALPRRVWIVGCQVAACDEVGIGLSEPVRRAVPAAVQRVYDIVATLKRAASQTYDPV